MLQVDSDGVARRAGEKERPYIHQDSILQQAEAKGFRKSKPADLSMGYARKVLRKELMARKAAASSGKKKARASAKRKSASAPGDDVSKMASRRSRPTRRVQRAV